MPWKSDKQRKYLYANKPKVAKKFAKDSNTHNSHHESKTMKLPDDVKSGIEQLAKSVAAHKMSAEIAIAQKPKDKSGNGMCPKDKSGKDMCPKDKSGKDMCCEECVDKEEGTSLDSEVHRLLDEWTETDPKTRAGKYYHDLKKVYDASKGMSKPEEDEMEYDDPDE